MSDLIERLRGNGAVPVTVMTKTLCREAADEIERLTAELERREHLTINMDLEHRAEIERLQAKVDELEGVLDEVWDQCNDSLEGLLNDPVRLRERIQMMLDIEALAATEPGR